MKPDGARRTLAVGDESKETLTDSAYAKAQEAMLRVHGVNAESRMIEAPSLQTRAHALVGGEGPPLVMLIGGGVPAAMWAPLMGQLRDRTTYAVDLPNQGLSGPVRWTTEKYASMGNRFLPEILEGLNIGSPDFVAQSMGGLFATWLAISRPDRVRSISYVGCPAFFLDSGAPLPLRLLGVPGLGRLLMRLQSPSPRQVASFATLAGEDFSDKPELSDLILAMERVPEFGPGLRSLMGATVTLRGAKRALRVSERELARVCAPVQFIWGRHDPFGSVAVGRRASAAMSNSQFHVVAGGHAPWIDRPEEVGTLVRSFLEEFSKAAPGH